LSSHCPHHRHLEWLKLMREQLWAYAWQIISWKPCVPWSTNTQTSCYST
jgi:hypothetical protein